MMKSRFFLASVASIMLLFNLKMMAQSNIITGAEQLDQLIPLIDQKSVGLVVNQTSVVGTTHLVDTLHARGVGIQRIFAPEHGFRGDRDAGEKIRNSRDETTGVPLVSLYGKNYKPTKRQVKDLDYMIFDIQDVGVRCYTYISTLHYVMEACAESNVPLIVLDRPNPSAHYVDGPVLDTAFSSFVGVHPIPLVYGMTMGELAQMVNGEGWLADGLKCDLQVVPLENYDHQQPYALPIRPSPNLPDEQSIALYPSLVFFEGTNMSLGRGTQQPFQMIGHPNPMFGEFQFTPESIPGMSKNPPYKDQTCYGVDLRTVNPPNQVDISYVIDFYQKSKGSPQYFNSFFNLLAGTDQLRKAIEAGKSEAEIRAGWQDDLKRYEAIRSKYLLYP